MKTLLDTGAEVNKGKYKVRSRSKYIHRVLLTTSNLNFSNIVVNHKSYFLKNKILPIFSS